jgi:hypothetical protein
MAAIPSEGDGSRRRDGFAGAPCWSGPRCGASKAMHLRRPARSARPKADSAERNGADGSRGAHALGVCAGNVEGTVSPTKSLTIAGSVAARRLFRQRRALLGGRCNRPIRNCSPKIQGSGGGGNEIVRIACLTLYRNSAEVYETANRSPLTGWIGWRQSGVPIQNSEVFHSGSRPRLGAFSIGHGDIPGRLCQCNRFALQPNFGSLRELNHAAPC